MALDKSLAQHVLDSAKKNNRTRIEYDLDSDNPTREELKQLIDMIYDSKLKFHIGSLKNGLHKEVTLTLFFTK